LHLNEEYFLSAIFRKQQNLFKQRMVATVGEAQVLVVMGEVLAVVEVVVLVRVQALMAMEAPHVDSA